MYAQKLNAQIHDSLCEKCFADHVFIFLFITFPHGFPPGCWPLIASRLATEYIVTSALVLSCVYVRDFLPRQIAL